VIDLGRRLGGVSRLYGLQGLKNLQSSHVVVVGLGGVGSWAAEALARSGVGRLTLIDMDHVAESNINRQIHATDPTLGMAKVQAMRQRLASFAPQCQVLGVEEFLNSTNLPQLLASGVDGLLDACDQFAAKVAMAAWAVENHVTFAMVGAAGGKKLAQAVCLDDLSRVTHDPLLAKVRYALRRNHGFGRDTQPMRVACVFSREPVAEPVTACDDRADGSLNCHGYGSAVAVTATFGLCAAGHLINQLAARA
jgi:tRNA A37 threonylcarbamoyladenosine dehydratase